MGHGILRDALEGGDFERFRAAAAYLESRGDLDARRRRKIEAGRRGGWRFKALGLWTRAQSGYKRRRAARWRTMSLEEIVAAYR